VHLHAGLQPATPMTTKPMTTSAPMTPRLPPLTTSTLT
jgi:hypothetical protein